MCIFKSSGDNIVRWMPQDLSDDKSTLFWHTLVLPTPLDWTRQHPNLKMDMMNDDDGPGNGLVPSRNKQLPEPMLKQVTRSQWVNP